MSLLPDQTFYNSTTSFFGAGGGGGGNTLQSPATVTPAANGQVLLSLIQSTGSPLPAAGILIQSTNGNDAGIQIDSTAGGATYIALGTNSSIFQSVNGASPTVLETQDNGGVSYMTVDVGQNVITLGNPVVQVGTTPGITANQPITLAFPSKAAFSPTTVTSTGGPWVAGDNTIALGGFGRGMYVIYGDTGAATTPTDLECRPISIFVIDPAFTVSGGGSGSDTNWNMSPNGTGGLTLNLTNAPSSAFSMKVMPLYVF